MRREFRRRDRRPVDLANSGRAGTRRDRASSLAFEPLEERQLLSLYQGPTRSRAVFSGGAFYQVSVTGGGFEQLSQVGSGHHRIIGITLFGTTQSSQLTITLKSAAPAFGSANTELQIGNINVRSGLLGGINAAGAANLLGNVTNLNGSVQTIAFNDLGPNAQINVVGSVGSFQANTAAFSANGLINITGDVTGQFNVSSLSLNGGRVIVGDDVDGGLNLGGLNISQGGEFVVGNDLGAASTLGAVDINAGRFVVGHDVSGTLTTNDLVVENTGQLIVTHDVTGGLQVNGSATIKSNGLVHVGDDLAGLNVVQGLTLDTSGKLEVDTDVTGPINVGTGLSLSNNALFTVGRDITGAATISGNLSLDSGGSISVGRNTSTLTVNGNVLFTPSAGTINIQGNVAGLTINGIYQGRSNTNMASPELIIGLNLTNLSVLGGVASQGGIEDANISVGKDILGFGVAHGVFNSLITAGVLIDGSQQSSSANGNISPDGTDAVFDSQIIAGQTINNFEIVGNVNSDWVTNPTPTGLPTRIIAGENRQGNWTSGGLIDNFQITGALIDSVLAASVQPYGGDGSVPPTGYAAPRTPATPPGPGVPTNYNAPAGIIYSGTFSAPVPNANFGYFSYLNETPYPNPTQPTPVYNMTIDPDVHVNILPGQINPSFASAPLPTSVTTTTSSGTAAGATGGATSSATTTTTTTFVAIPTESTVLGGVITTSHGNNPDGSDFAGIYAADTRGVFVGVLPTQS